MKDRISLGTLWEEATLFVRKEFALLLPVAALGFGLPMVMLLLAVPTDQAESGKLMAGAWMLWFVPCGLLSLLGSLSVSAMALRPGASVRECLGIALKRLPSGLGLFGLYLVLQIALALPVALLARIDAAIGNSTALLAALGNLAIIAVIIWLFVRLMPIWAVLSERGEGPIATIRTAFAATRGRYRTLLLVRVVASVAGVIALLVTLVPLGAVCALIGAAAGTPMIGALLSYLATAAVFAVLVTLWTVYVARLYRRIAGASIAI